MLTKGAGVEGTALLAHEAEAALLAAGVAPSTIAAARGFLEHISIAEEARIAAAEPDVTALHDVTEGGVAAAAAELSEAVGRGFAVDIERIPIAEVTRAITSALGLDPLGLIGSGALLVCIRPAAAESLLAALRAAGLRGCDHRDRPRHQAGNHRHPGWAAHDWPRFATDEAARYLAVNAHARGNPTRR